MYKDKIVEEKVESGRRLLQRQPVEKIVYKDKIVEKKVEFPRKEKIVYKDKPVEKIVEKVVYKEKKSRVVVVARDPSSMVPRKSPSKSAIRLVSSMTLRSELEIITDLSNSLVLLYIIITDIVVVVVIASLKI